MTIGGDTTVISEDESTYFYQPGSYTPMESAGFLMRRVLSSILQQADANLAVHGLTYVQWLPLYKLLLCADTTSAVLAKDLGMDPASVTRALDRIEAKGLLRRDRSTTDRRVVHLTLTDEGRRIAADVPQVLSRVLNKHLEGFTHAECEMLLGMLKRMIHNGDAMRAAGCEALGMPARRSADVDVGACAEGEIDSHPPPRQR